MLQKNATIEPALNSYSMNFYNLYSLLAGRAEAAGCAYIHNKISNTLESGKNFWKEMRNPGLIPKTSDALHGFMPDELNALFSSISLRRSCGIT